MHPVELLLEIGETAAVPPLIEVDADEVRLLIPSLQAQGVQGQGVGEGPGPQRKGKGPLPGCLHVFGSLTGGITDRPRGGDTHQISAVRPVQSLLSQRVRLAEGLPAGAEAVIVQFQARGVLSRPIAHSYEALGLVKSEPPAHPAPEQLRHFLRAGLKAPGGLRVLPAALPLQCLGKVPMEQSHPGLDSLLQ